MRNYIDILMTIVVTFTLIITMLWPFTQSYQALDKIDKLVHCIAFAALVFPLARSGRIALLPVFIGASTFGGAIEIIQPNFNRSASLADWVADITGIVLGIACGLLYRILCRK